MKKTYTILITILIISLTALVITYLKKHQIIKNIKASFHEYITTNKDSNLYNENKEILGTIYKDTYLELEETNIKTSKDIYFKIKDTNYYLKYTDVTKQEKQENKTVNNYYLNLGKKITTNKPTNLYSNEKLELTINDSLTFEIISTTENYYTINYLNKEYQIKKEEIIDTQEIEINNGAKYISIINYNKIDDCNDTSCITNETLKKQLNILKENNYYTITIEDYIKWKSDLINLKEKAILITSQQENINEIANQYNLNIETNIQDIEFIDSNTKNEKGNTTNNRYTIKNITTDEMFNQIIQGEPITYIETNLTKQHNLPDINKNATQIAVLNYHFFFDPEIGETCPDGNCKTVQDFEQELNYLKQNQYKTLTMEEFKKWMYQEIELPARSVLITIDDGAMGTGTHNGNKLIPLLEKYQTNATLFLITGWWPIENYSSKYLDIESHTYNMHEGNYCETESRGSKLLCSSKEEIKKDLQTSIDITGSKQAFCFPMYVYNDKTLQVLKELDFSLGFVGGDYKASRNDDKYKIPRYHIYRETTLDTFIDMIS